MRAPEVAMNRTGTREELEQKVHETKEAIAGWERRMASHPAQFDDRKRGYLCNNYRARAHFKARRDEARRELVNLEAQLGAVEPQGATDISGPLCFANNGVGASPASEAAPQP